MERHGLVPSKEGAKSSTHTNIHTHTRTRNQPKVKEIKNILSTSDLKLINSAVFLYIFFFTSLKIRLILLFFFSKCCCYFFHTLVKHGHIAPDYRLQNHIHSSLSHRDAPTQMQRGLGGGFQKTLLCLSKESSLKADPSLRSPSWSNFLFLFFFFLIIFFVLAKSKFVKPQKSDVCPFRSVFFCFFLGDAHTDVTTGFLSDPLFDRPVLLCGDPLPELASDIPPTRERKKKNTREVTSLAWCLTSPSWA